MTGWIATRWLEVMAASWGGPDVGPAVDMRNLQPGALDIQPGQITMRVSGRIRQWTVTLWSAPLPGSRWSSALQRIAELGNLPAAQPLDAMLRALGLRLFPASVQSVCTCPEPRTPCVHTQFVALLCADEFDRRPGELFVFRGAPRSLVEQTMRALTGAQTTPGRQAAFSQPPQLSLRGFWQGLGSPPQPSPTADATPERPRRDLPRRIEAPATWDKGGSVRTAMDAICKALADWSPPPTADLDAIPYGFSGEELSGLRTVGAAREPAPAAPAPQQPSLRDAKPSRRPTPAAALPTTGGLVCPQCGTSVRQEWAYCGHCGHRLG